MASNGFDNITINRTKISRKQKLDKKKKKRKKDCMDISSDKLAKTHTRKHGRR